VTRHGPIKVAPLPRIKIATKASRPTSVEYGPEAEANPQRINQQMHLRRAWEAPYLPQRTGELRLTSARTFRDHEEDDGIGDAHEGGQRTGHEGHLTLEWQDPDNLLPALRDLEIDVHLAFESEPVDLKGVKAGTTSFLQELDVGDSEIPSPHLSCFSHQPTNENEWMNLRGSLPSNRDAWTYVFDADRLKTEVECGIYRWLKLNGAASHKIETFHGPVQYTYGDAPTPQQPEELLLRNELLFGRWLRKRQRFKKTVGRIGRKLAGVIIWVAGFNVDRQDYMVGHPQGVVTKFFCLQGNGCHHINRAGAGG